MSTNGTSLRITIGCLSGCPTKSDYRNKKLCKIIKLKIEVFKEIPESKDCMLKEPFCERGAFDLRQLMSHLQMLH